MRFDEEALNDLSRRLIGCALRVANTLGHGFVEKVYENALILELRKAGVDFERQKHLQVHYEGTVVGDFAIDLVVAGELIVELKATAALAPVHRAQCLNYLRAANLRLCLLLNFGAPKLEVRRIVNGL